MKSTIIQVIIIVIILFFLAQITISFSPFSIKFGRPLFAIGWVLICVGIGCIQLDSERKGRQDLINGVKSEIQNISKISNKEDLQ